MVKKTRKKVECINCNHVFSSKLDLPQCSLCKSRKTRILDKNVILSNKSSFIDPDLKEIEKYKFTLLEFKELFLRGKKQGLSAVEQKRFLLLFDMLFKD